MKLERKQIKRQKLWGWETGSRELTYINELGSSCLRAEHYQSIASDNCKETQTRRLLITNKQLELDGMITKTPILGSLHVRPVSDAAW